jgi:hypothetical protein
MHKLLMLGCSLVLATLLVGTEAGATGLIPPANPLLNVSTNSSDWLTAINSARSQEGVGPMAVAESGVSNLPIPEQVFLIVNRERIDRGEAPISYMTSQLNSYAAGGAQAPGDPSIPSTLTGGTSMTWGGSIWAGGMSNVFEADYYWMYEDGWAGLASLTSNGDCVTPISQGCWGHRDVMLHPYASCGGGAAPTLSMGAAYSATGYSGGSIAAVFVGTCGPPPTDITMAWNQVTNSVSASTETQGAALMPNGQGYWEVSPSGAVTAFGQAVNYGSMADHSLNAAIVGMAATSDGGGYWLVASDGGIFAFGDATFQGSAGAIHLNQPIVGMAAAPDGHGYWMVASDGGIFSFGGAPFLGSTGAIHLNKPIVGMAADPQTGGYWLVAADGGIFSFGAPFDGSTGALNLNKPIVGMSALSNGEGYRFVAADGGVFTFGSAAFYGSMGGKSLPSVMVTMINNAVNGGYWLVDSLGNVYTYAKS